MLVYRCVHPNLYRTCAGKQLGVTTRRHLLLTALDALEADFAKMAGATGKAKFIETTALTSVRGER
jgi:hypothetical protein